MIRKALITVIVACVLGNIYFAVRAGEAADAPPPPLEYRFLIGKAGKAKDTAEFQNRVNAHASSGWELYQLREISYTKGLGHPCSLAIMVRAKLWPHRTSPSGTPTSP